MNSYLLGVINKQTGRYESIISVDKPNEYKCIDCGGDLILRKGEKNFQSFIHKNKFPACSYFKTPTELMLKTDALLHLKELLDTNKVTIYSKCSICKFNFETKLPKFITTVKNLNSVDCVDETNKTLCKFVFGINAEATPIDVPIYRININELILRITTSYATKKVELVCEDLIICDKCQARYR